jgi:hypothetical protein
MADNNAVTYVAVYDDVNSALADLDAFEQLHDEDLIGKYDAAVIDQENGEPHIVKRVDHPSISVVAEVFGGGALPSSKLKEAAKSLDAGEAALVVVGDPTLEKGFDKAVTRADKVAKESFDVAVDQLAADLKSAAAS